MKTSHGTPFSLCSVALPPSSFFFFSSVVFKELWTIWELWATLVPFIDPVFFSFGSYSIIY